MKSPITGKEMRKMTRNEVISFRKEEFTVLFHYYLCEESGEQFTDAEMDTLNIVQVYNQYRSKYNLPFPDEIRGIRERFDLSAAKMAEILGFGINVYRQYESGEVPNVSNARLIQLVKDPAEFRKLVLASNVLAGNALERLLKRIDGLVSMQSDPGTAWLPNYLMAVQDSGRASIFTGYRTPSLARLLEMIVYFAKECKPWKTKLNKLLFYADFGHYKRTGYSVSGAEYVAIQMGPVPRNFSSIFEYAGIHNDVDIIYEEFRSGEIGESFQPLPTRDFDPSLFDELELLTLRETAGRFREVSTSDIVKFSHEESAWLENVNGKNKISYDFAFKLVHI